MTNIRKEVVGSFIENKLLLMVKDNLDQLDIPYEDNPGGFGDTFCIKPSDIEGGI